MEQKVTEKKLKFPSEIVDLPSKGLIYPKDNPLSSGKIEMKYMTAKEEDILTNTNYIQKGIVLDKLLESLIISDMDYNELITGDKNALLIASRVLGYGKDYTFKAFSTVSNEIEDFTIDLTTLEDKLLDPKNLKQEGLNEFDFTLPTSKIAITFKLLTHKDERSISKELEGLKKINKDIIPENTTLKYIVTSIDGDREKKTIRDFVDNYLLAKDAQPLRDEIKRISPDVNLTYEVNGEEVDIPIGVNFFWPSGKL
jgi:hypothetical protein